MLNKVACSGPSKSQTHFLSASLYFSKRGTYWDRLCRDVVGRLVVTRVHCGQTVHPRPIFTMEHLIGNPTPGIQWYKFRPPGVTPNRGMGPREALFVKLLWPLVHKCESPELCSSVTKYQDVSVTYRLKKCCRLKTLKNFNWLSTCLVVN